MKKMREELGLPSNPKSTDPNAISYRNMAEKNCDSLRNDIDELKKSSATLHTKIDKFDTDKFFAQMSSLFEKSERRQRKETQNAINRTILDFRDKHNEEIDHKLECREKNFIKMLQANGLLTNMPPPDKTQFQDYDKKMKEYFREEPVSDDDQDMADNVGARNEAYPSANNFFSNNV